MRGPALLAILAASSALSAATHTWKGAANGVWSTGANWTGGAPTSSEAGGTVVVFGANTTSVDNIQGLVVDAIHFTGGGNLVKGTFPLTLGGGTPLAAKIVSDQGANVLDASLPLVSTVSTLTVHVATGNLEIAGNVSGFGLTFEGVFIPSELSLTGTNSYTGTTWIKSGTVYLDSPTYGGAIPGDIHLGPDPNLTPQIREL
ncbi:MAG TPA: hypothetical protein VGR00_15390, partial [Thermoanaerobaculia bacterium]|nr:hypothetical protein [Thermoanaerobaculia bacterium]